MQYKFHVFVFLSVAAYWLHCFCLVNLCSKQPYILLFDSMIQLILKIVFWLYYSLVRQFVVDKHLTRRLCTFNHVTGLCTPHRWVDSSHLPLSINLWVGHYKKSLFARLDWQDAKRLRYHEGLTWSYQADPRAERDTPQWICCKNAKVGDISFLIESVCLFFRPYLVMGQLLVSRYTAVQSHGFKTAIFFCYTIPVVQVGPQKWQESLMSVRRELTLLLLIIVSS